MYTENNYAKKPRTTDDKYRQLLVSWQVPAILQHFGSLEGKTFIDVGAGDIVLGECQNEIGRPEQFFAQDLSDISLKTGIGRLNSRGVDTSNVTTLVSDDFDFSLIEDGTIDYAFSNSLFSHLSLNSILLCLANLRPKMKPGAKYLSSMIVVPEEEEWKDYKWPYLEQLQSYVTSRPNKDPYHYSRTTIYDFLGLRTGFSVNGIYEYGNPIQELVEFVVI
jgi:hypothetical protein